MAENPNQFAVNVITKDGQPCLEITCAADANELHLETSRILEVLYAAAKVANQGVDAALSAENPDFSSQVIQANQERVKTTREI